MQFEQIINQQADNKLTFNTGMEQRLRFLREYLVEGFEYRCRLQSFSQYGLSDYSDYLYFKAEFGPEPPTDLKVNNVTQETAVLSWQHKSEDSNISFLVRHASSNMTLELTKSSIIVTDLIPGSTESFYISAINQVGGSTEVELSFQTKPGIATQPVVSILAQTESNFTIGWSLPHNGGSNVFGYKIRFWNVKNREMVQDIYIGASEKNYTISEGLENTGIYELQMTARNQYGESKPSELI